MHIYSKALWEGINEFGSQGLAKARKILGVCIKNSIFNRGLKLSHIIVKISKWSNDDYCIKKDTHCQFPSILTQIDEECFSHASPIQFLCWSYTHKITPNGTEVRHVFLDISKAFDKVWLDGVIFKLEQNGISGDMLNILIDYLSNRKHRVVLNGQFSV